MNNAIRDGDRRLHVLVATALPDFVAADLSDAFDVTFATEGTSADRLSLAGGCDALLVSLDVRLDRATIAALPASVRALATYSVGLDHIDVDFARARGIPVFNTPGVLAPSVAEAAMLLMLGAARRATESIALARSGEWRGWTARQLVGVSLAGRKLAILGMGGIGRAVAKRARGFDLEILYHSRTRVPEEEALGATWVDNMDDLLPQADVVVLACPSTAETRHFINAGRLAGARRGLIVVNVGRGDLVDDTALLSALRDGTVGAAGLDVFSGEPQIDPGYLKAPNVFLTPHIGSSTVEARRGMGFMLIDALRAWSSQAAGGGGGS
ncbi:MAG TPA: D-glycerate dehydrogenase [Novosphingobium sp.]|nr:D-glycerate dehydrogenase [Novosphingobium sp.]